MRDCLFLCLFKSHLTLFYSGTEGKGVANTCGQHFGRQETTDKTQEMSVTNARGLAKRVRRMPEVDETSSNILGGNFITGSKVGPNYGNCGFFPR